MKYIVDKIYYRHRLIILWNVYACHMVSILQKENISINTPQTFIAWRNEINVHAVWKRHRRSQNPSGTWWRFLSSFLWGGALNAFVDNVLQNVFNTSLPPTWFHTKDLGPMMTSSNGNIFRVTVPLWGESGEFPSQRPVTLSFHVFFQVRLNKRLTKQSIC